MNKRLCHALYAASIAVGVAACGGSDEDDANGSMDEIPVLAAANAAPDSNEGPSDNSPVSTTDFEIPAQFDWSSNQSVEISLQLNDLFGIPSIGTGVSVYPVAEAAMDESMREPFPQEMFDLVPIATGVTDGDGAFNTVLRIPGHVAQHGYVYVVTRLMGVASAAYVPLETTNGFVSASWEFGPATDDEEAIDSIKTTVDSGFREILGNAASGDYFQQPFESHYSQRNGAPSGIRSAPVCDIDSMVSGDLCNVKFDSDIISRLDRVAPDGRKPDVQYLEAGPNASNLIFSKKAKVLVSFLHEGAGYQNTFGFFTYDPQNAPADHKSLDTAKVLFPNASYLRGGGALRSGNSIYMGEVDPNTGNSGVGFWLAAHGWAVGRGQGYTGHHFYSLSALNPEPDQAQRKHALLLAEEVNLSENTRRLWVTFEDIRRDSGRSDEDFNDLVMQVEITPADALANGTSIPILPNSAGAVDADRDGVSDSNDIDDNDPLRAFEQFYPGKNEWGTILAEDNWPKQGDYDMNDLVVRYRVREVLDSAASIKDVQVEYRLEARGAAFHNGFAVSLGDSVFADNIESATLNGDTTGPLDDANHLAYTIFDDAWAHTWEGGAKCWTFNTLADCDPLDGTTFKLDVTFANAVTRTKLGMAPYNPYVYAHKIGPNVSGFTRLTSDEASLYSENGQIKDIEIHLPNRAPTNGQDTSMFGTGDDDSDGVSKFYLTAGNLPWLIDVPYSIEYPVERTDISSAYPDFQAWVESGGTKARDWYQSPAFDSSLIYNPRPILLADEPLVKLPPYE